MRPQHSHSRARPLSVSYRYKVVVLALELPYGTLQLAQQPMDGLWLLYFLLVQKWLWNMGGEDQVFSEENWTSNV